MAKMLQENIIVWVFIYFIFLAEFAAKVQSVQDNTGTHFLVMFLKNMNRQLDIPMQLSMTTVGPSSVEVRIQTPKWASNFSVNATVTVNQGQLTVFSISDEIQKTDSVKDYKSLLVTSTDNIILYASNLEDRTGDSYIIYPVDNLGTQYVAMSYPHSRYKRSYIGCVAAYDNTNIMVTPSTNATLKLDKQSYKSQFPIELDQFENFQIEAMDITGSVVTSDKTIACFSGQRYSQVLCGSVIGGSDHMEEQLLPVSTWSYRYFVVSNPEYRADAGDLIRIVSFNGSSSVKIVTNTAGQNKCERIQITAGSFHEFFLSSGDAAFIAADDLILVGQFSCSGGIEKQYGDSRLMLSLADDSFLPEYTFITPSSNLTSPEHTYGLILITETLVRDYITMDNEVVSNNITWRNIDMIGFSFGALTIGIGVHKLQCHVTGSYGGYVYGHVNNEEFGTVIGRNLNKDKRKVSVPQRSHIKGYMSTKFTIEYINATFLDPEMMSLKTSSIVSCLSVCFQLTNCLHVAVFQEAERSVECMLYGYETVCSQPVQTDRHTVYRRIYS